MHGHVQYQQHRLHHIAYRGRCEHCNAIKRTFYDHCHKHGWIRGEVCGSRNTRMAKLDWGIKPDRWERWMIEQWLRCPDCAATRLGKLMGELTAQRLDSTDLEPSREFIMVFLSEPRQ
jgi:hypothetical protein